MKAFEAAIQILAEAEKPLHAREITARMIETGLWKTKGKTPAATVGAMLYADIKKKGADSPFVRVASQTFSLQDSTETETGATTSATITGTSFSDCAHKVLEAFGDKQPMHDREITEKALEEGWLVTGGKTPEATMYVQMISEIKRQQKRGEHPRFDQHGGGLFGLGKWVSRELVF